MSESAQLSDWIGRTEARDDLIASDRVRAMAATLDLDRAPAPGEELPLLWHWLFFNPAAPQRELGDDGHPRRGGFLPPIHHLPRRMWAGGRVRFLEPLKVPQAIRRESRIVKLDEKKGRSGDLVFVTVNHQIIGPNGVAIDEDHDIVYRGAAPPDAPAPIPPVAPDGAIWTREVRPDPVLLFRYSALTFNGHRIHYDQPYATGVEGYPGLVVHGPLIATLLVDLVARQGLSRRVTRFDYRAVSPLFAGAAFTVNGLPSADGGSIRVWATGPTGNLAMDGTAQIAGG